MNIENQIVKLLKIKNRTIIQITEELNLDNELMVCNIIGKLEYENKVELKDFKKIYREDGGEIYLCVYGISNEKCKLCSGTGRIFVEASEEGMKFEPCICKLNEETIKTKKNENLLMCKSDLEIYIKEYIFNKTHIEGNFILHSGKPSKHMFDVLKIINDELFMSHIQNFFKTEQYIMGIEFGGALLASLSKKPYGFIRKDGTVYSHRMLNYTLVDDVVTTENPIKEAIKYIGVEPIKIKCVVDRRLSEYKTLKIESIIKFDENTGKYE